MMVAASFGECCKGASTHSIARVVVLSHEQITMEFMSVVINFMSVQRYLKVFVDVHGCSWMFARCS
jgi:hypothetical protein